MVAVPADVTDALGDRRFSTSCFLCKAPQHPAALRWKMPLGACPEEMHMWKHPWVTEIWSALLLKLTNSWKLTVYKATELSIQLKHTQVALDFLIVREIKLKLIFLLQTLVTKGEKWEERDRLGVWDWYLHTTVYREVNKDQLYSTGSSPQYSVIIYTGK